MDDLPLLDQCQITSIHFCLLSPEEIRRRSVLQVDSSTIYDKNAPKSGGINDHRMGTGDRRIRCGTCRNKVEQCVGHEGHLELSWPVYHIGYLDMILKTLRCVCYFCSRILMDEEALSCLQLSMETTKSRNRLNVMSALLKGKKTCPHCLGQVPQYQKSGLIIQRDWKIELFETVEEETFCCQLFTAKEAGNILHHISDTDLRLLGFQPHISKPSYAVLEVLVVPPPITRPSIMVHEGSRARGQDDLTHKLQDIHKSSTDLYLFLQTKPNPTVDPSFVEHLATLQFHVATYINNDIRGQKQSLQRSGAPTRGLTQRIKGKKTGKTGRIRGNLMGKRVDFSSRTVVTPDPFMGIGEVGVPEQIAKTLTFPDTVTIHNLSTLKQLVIAGPTALAGAETVIWPDGSKTSLHYCKDLTSVVTRLTVGCIVERHLQEGEIVLFNRQPSLHKKSLMAHRARIMTGMTFRVNPSACAPYNCDFDGDEMNLHLPQTYEARAEALILQDLPVQLLTAQANKPAMGIIQDALVGTFRLTNINTFLTRDEMMQLIMCLQHPLPKVKWILPVPAIVKPSPLWTGKQMISILFPEELQLLKIVRAGADQVECMDRKERYVHIRDGELLTGSLCKQTMGSIGGGIIHILVKDVGTTLTAQFMGDVQRMVNYWLTTKPFTIGLKDCCTSKDTQEKVTRTIDRSFKRIQEMVHEVEGLGMGSTTIEHAVTQRLSKVLDKTGRIAMAEAKEDNALYCMITAQSKGNAINISQIGACVGQQSIDGKRIHVPGKRGLKMRTLPIYLDGEDTPQSHAFVSESYEKGLRPDSFFFHMMGGREGLVDTAVKTASTGYLQRRLTKAMESYKAEHDQSVRDSQGNIIQFCYGIDGLDSTYLEKCSLSIVEWSNKKIDQCFGFTPSDLNLLMERNQLPPTWFYKMQQYIQKVKEYRDEVRRIKYSLFNLEIDGTIYVPNNIARWITRANKYQRDSNFLNLTFITLDEAIQFVVILCERLHSLSKHSDHVFTDALIYTVCHPRILMIEHSFNLVTLQWLQDNIVNEYSKILVESGEMVGALAAQSIGELCTQLTLNTFHFSGVQSKNITLGLPRFKELVEVSRKMKTPSVTLFLNEPFCTSQTACETLKNNLPYTMLADATISSSLIYDPDLYHTSVIEDNNIVQLSSLFRTEEKQIQEHSQWVIRLVLNKPSLSLRHLVPSDIAQLIEEFTAGYCEILYSDANMLSWILRVRIKNVRAFSVYLAQESWKQDLDRNLTQSLLSILLTQLYICGIHGIRGASIRQCSKLNFNDETGEIVKSSQYVIDTSGSALVDLWSISSVDWKNTISNDTVEVFNLLGIEAAASVLFHEIKQVLSFDGSYVNDRHIMMAVDTIVIRGWLMPISRHGINRIDTSTLLRSSFEETVDVLFEAAAFAEVDPMNGVTENLMLGQLAPMGTGCVSLVMKQELKVKPKKPKTKVLLTGAVSDLGDLQKTKYLRFPEVKYDSALSDQLYYPQSPNSVYSLDMNDNYLPSSPPYDPGSPYVPSSPPYDPASPRSPVYCPSSPKNRSFFPEVLPIEVPYPTGPTYNEPIASSSSSSSLTSWSPLDPIDTSTDMVVSCVSNVPITFDGLQRNQSFAALSLLEDQHYRPRSPALEHTSRTHVSLPTYRPRSPVLDVISVSDSDLSQIFGNHPRPIPNFVKKEEPNLRIDAIKLVASLPPSLKTATGEINIDGLQAILNLVKQNSSKSGSWVP